MDGVKNMCLNVSMVKAAVHSSPTFLPLYRQIKDLMVKRLDAGEWRPGAVIPAEAELAVRFNVSQGTVRKAIDEMVSENMLVRRQGKGTFVATHDDPQQDFRFLRLVADSGTLSHFESVPLECWRGKAGADTARVLGLDLAAPVVVLRRVLRFDHKPVVAEEIYLPGELFGELTLDLASTHPGSLYRLYETRFGVRMIRADERVRAVLVDRLSAGWLNLPEGSPVLSVERVAFTYGDRPVEWRRGFYSTNEHCYLNELV